MARTPLAIGLQHPSVTTPLRYYFKLEAQSTLRSNLCADGYHPSLGCGEPFGHVLL